MNNKKITPHQLYTMTAMMSLGGSLMVVAGTVSAIAKQDAWLTGVAAIAYGIGIIYMYYFLASRYPGMTLIGLTKKILGKWVGAAICIGYVFLFLTIASHVPWYITGTCKRVMCETPRYILMIVFVVGVVTALLYGIETIVRSTELFLPVASFLFAITFVMLLNNVKFENIQPVLENGVTPVLSGSVFLSCYISLPIITMLMIIPGVNDMSKAYGALLKGFLWSSGVSTIVITMCILVLGSGISAILSFPTLTLVQSIDVWIIVTRVEYVVSVVWRITQFFVGVAFFYAGVMGLSELLGLKDYKKIVLPLGLIITLLSGIVFPSTVYQMQWVSFAYAPWIITFGFFIPVIMVCVYLIKKYVFRRT